MNISINCSFEVTHNHISKSIPCMVDVEENEVNYIEHLEDYKLCSGHLVIDDKPIANAVVTFIQPQNNQGNTVDYDTNHYTDGINGVKNWHWNNTFEMHSNNLIKDKVITNEAGHYTTFITNGVYDIKVQCNGNIEVVNNQEITDGLTEEYYFIVEGQIKEKLKSTYIMCNSYARNIRLKYINQYNHFINGELIISKDNNLIVYKKINNEDLFALEPNIYDIRLRADNINEIIIKDFEFTEDTDFVEELLNKLQNNNIIYVEDKEVIPDPIEPIINNDETLKE